ncbi:MAG: hypothetical protein OZSIB_2374 [Candidatus Ozemobacter sibiricus]|uniref:Uncharacterized protein n=1 Tax=Candidatus Ozemobacter sibiricus TaxID=2268124 RepID=A0A367ZT22_9BACT|nr:MAG: hypothetical protein OZSIB_2374 [Candidatus Ozemobacter sibiricus]
MPEMMLSTGAKIVLAVALGFFLAVAGLFIQRFAYVDFGSLKVGLKPQVVSEGSDVALATSSADLEDEFPNRDKHLNEARAIQYVNHATRDYFSGSYDEALRRLERAKWYDPHNFGAFKLSGQIQFERSQYRKAFNEWARATQLPNYDQSLLRDLDVLKRLIRYCRTEIDRLQKTVNQNPEDRISAARLRELEYRMAD